MSRYTEAAKVSPLGAEYHYHETGDGPEWNTTDSAFDDGPHDHGLQTGLWESVATGKATGVNHKHSLRAWRLG